MFYYLLKGYIDELKDVLVLLILLLLDLLLSYPCSSFSLRPVQIPLDTYTNRFLADFGSHGYIRHYLPRIRRYLTNVSLK